MKLINLIKITADLVKKEYRFQFSQKIYWTFDIWTISGLNI